MTQDRVAALETQQSLLTDGLAKMLTNGWIGFPSLQADLEALSPGIQLAPRPPLVESEVGPPARPAWWQYFQQHRDWPMDPQAYGWTCSVCSTTWVLQATGLCGECGREDVAEQIGYPSCVNEAYGCLDINCIVRVLESYGAVARQFWVTFDQAWTIAGLTTGVLNGLGWYHFVAIRGQSGSDIAIANSALGYEGVYSTLNRAQFNALGPVQVAVLDPRS